MQNWVIHGGKAQDTSIKYIWQHLWWQSAICQSKHIWWHLWWQGAIWQSNTSGGIYGGRLRSANQNTDHIISGK